MTIVTHHIFMLPFFHRRGPGFCSELTTTPGVVLVQVSPSYMYMYVREIVRTPRYRY